MGEASGADTWGIFGGGSSKHPGRMLRAGERDTTRLRLKQVSPVLQRILPRAKRKPAPKIRRIRTRSLIHAVYWHDWGLFLPRRDKKAREFVEE